MALGTSGAGAQSFLRGDANGDGTISGADVAALGAALYGGGGSLPNPDAGDANDSGGLDVGDLVSIQSFLRGGPMLPPPFPIPGEDPTPDVFPPTPDPRVSLFLGAAEAAPGGDPVFVPLTLSSSEAVYGLEIALRFDPFTVHLDRWSLAGSILESVQAEFVMTDQTNLPVIAHGWLAAVVDHEAPWTGGSIPPGTNLPVAELEFTALADAPPGPTAITLQSGIGTPPRLNSVSILGGDLLVPLLQHGSVDVRPTFIRGDLNRDHSVDVADAIRLITYLFAGGDPLECEEAADINNDLFIDVADAIFLLNYYFVNGPAPALPFPEPGPDPDDDGIDCEE